MGWMSRSKCFWLGHKYCDIIKCGGVLSGYEVYEEHNNRSNNWPDLLGSYSAKVKLTLMVGRASCCKINEFKF